LTRLMTGTGCRVSVSRITRTRGMTTITLVRPTTMMIL
jgi:hypothetical protein